MILKSFDTYTYILYIYIYILYIHIYYVYVFKYIGCMAFFLRHDSQGLFIHLLTYNIYIYYVYIYKYIGCMALFLRHDPQGLCDLPQPVCRRPGTRAALVVDVWFMGWCAYRHRNGCSDRLPICVRRFQRSEIYRRCIMILIVGNFPPRGESCLCVVKIEGPGKGDSNSQAVYEHALLLPPSFL